MTLLEKVVFTSITLLFSALIVLLMLGGEGII